MGARNAPVFFGASIAITAVMWPPLHAKIESAPQKTMKQPIIHRSRFGCDCQRGSPAQCIHVTNLPGKMCIRPNQLSLGYIVFVIGEMTATTHIRGIFPRELIMFIAEKYIAIGLPMIACGYSCVIVAFNEIGNIKVAGDPVNVAANICWQTDGSITNYNTRTSMFQVTLPICSVIGGHMFGIATTQNGFFSWGNNAFGQLGLGDFNTVLIPEYSCVHGRVIAADCGSVHVMMIIDPYAQDDGGSLGSRPLGDGPRSVSADTSMRTAAHPEGTSAQPEPPCDNGVEIARARAEACSRGMLLYGWGSNWGFRLGLPGTGDMSDSDCTPKLVPISDVSAVSCQMGYSLILAAGCVYLCRDDSRGPRKLRYTDVVEIFACCYQFAIYVREPFTGAIVRIFDEIPGASKQKPNEEPPDVFTHRSCEYDTINNCRRGHHRRVACSWVNLLRKSEFPGVPILIESAHDCAIVLTSRGLYMLEENTDKSVDIRFAGCNW